MGTFCSTLLPDKHIRPDKPTKSFSLYLLCVRQPLNINGNQNSFSDLFIFLCLSCSLLICCWGLSCIDLFIHNELSTLLPWGLNIWIMNHYRKSPVGRLHDKFFFSPVICFLFWLFFNFPPFFEIPEIKISNYSHLPVNITTLYQSLKSSHFFRNWVIKEWNFLFEWRP